MSAERSVIAAMIELACAKSTDWDSTIQHILSVEANVLEVERVSFWAVNDQPQSLVCEMAYQRSTRLFERGYTLAFAEHRDFFEAVLKPAPLVVEDVRADPRVRSMLGYFESRGISSVLDSPVWVEGQVAGVLCLEHVGPQRQWSESDESFAAAVAQTTAAALEARELAAARQGALDAAFLDQSSRTLHETLEAEEVSRRAVALPVPRLADAAILDLVDEDGAVRRVAFHHATAAGREVMRRAIRLGAFPPEAGPPLAERVIARHDSVLVPDLAEEVLFEAEPPLHIRKVFAALRDLGIRSLVATPLFVGDRMTGVLQLLASGRRYGVAELGLAEALGRRVASALENARLHRLAEEAVLARNRLIALAGHELRTPMTALLHDAEELVRQAGTESRAGVTQTAEDILEQVKRLDLLSRRMLDASQPIQQRASENRS
jgi:GAF domain-containing protein